MTLEAMRVCGIASGSGSTIGAVSQSTKSGILKGHVELGLVISTSPTAGVLERMRKAGFPEDDLLVLPKGWSKNRAMMAGFILAACLKRKIDFIGLYGALPLMPPEVVESYEKRMVNQHPGLIDPDAPPGYDFGGPSMHGKRVHAARIEFVRRTREQKFTGVISHWVAEGLDRGDVVHDRLIEITPDILTLAATDLAAAAERLNDIALPIEHAVQIHCLLMAARGRLQKIVRPPYWLVKPHEKGILDECKQLAIEIFPH